MGKTAIIFPGQGAQYTNMGKDFYDTYESARNVFKIADSVSPIPMAELIFQENEKLHLTKYTQIAILTMELAILQAAREKGLKADVYAGLSLGEYAAIAACNALTMRDSLALIVKRGALMEEAVPTGGAMAAIMGMEHERIVQICEQTSGVVSVANYNCPGQTVITGEEKAVEEAAHKLKEAGAKRCIPLKVSGPFHSELFLEASKELAKELKQITVHPIEIPYVANVTAEYVTDEGQIKNLLERQLYAPVRWQQSVERMILDGVERFIEIGPKKTLSGFVRKIKKDVRIENIETVKDLENIAV
ncbi:ACP S-malonyltransferase [Lachnospiraceae bacterium ZAX-1]